MRHRKSGRKLGRTASHRKATLANLATALFEHTIIKTTTSKAKEARRTVERLITFAKRGDLHSRRHVARTIKDKAIVKKLFDEIAPKYTERNGGYTRIIGLGQRQGDGADLSILELVGYEGVQMEKIEKQRAKREAKEKMKEQAEAEEKEAEGIEEPVEEEKKAKKESKKKEEKKKKESKKEKEDKETEKESPKKESKDKAKKKEKKKK